MNKSRGQNYTYTLENNKIVHLKAVSISPGTGQLATENFDFTYKGNNLVKVTYNGYKAYELEYNSDNTTSLKRTYYASTSNELKSTIRYYYTNGKLDSSTYQQSNGAISLYDKFIYTGDNITATNNGPRYEFIYTPIPNTVYSHPLVNLHINYPIITGTFPSQGILPVYLSKELVSTIKQFSNFGTSFSKWDYEYFFFPDGKIQKIIERPSNGNPTETYNYEYSCD